MITRKAFIDKVRQVKPDTVLFAHERRTPNHRGYAVEQGLKPFMGEIVFGQVNHCTAKGAPKKNPKWFTQLYTDLSWSTSDVTPGFILYFLKAR